MEIIIFLVFCSLSLAVIFLIAFIWSLKTGQFDDDYTPSLRMLLDEKISNTHIKPELKVENDLTKNGANEK